MKDADIDNRHDWYKPEDQFGPIAGARMCRKCGAGFAYAMVDWLPPERGCPAERGKVINHEELLKMLKENP